MQRTLVLLQREPKDQVWRVEAMEARDYFQDQAIKHAAHLGTLYTSIQNKPTATQSEGVIPGRRMQSAERKPLLNIEPHGFLLGSMPHDQQVRSIMLLDVDAESPAPDTLRLLLHVVFQPITIRRGLLTPSDYYVATTGGTVAVDAHNAELINHTVSNPFHDDVRVGREKLALRRSGSEHRDEFSPTDLKVKHKDEFGPIDLEVKHTNLGDSVEWRIDGHRGAKAVRDFLILNLHLEATFRWKTAIKTGTVRARPSDISLFDNSKRRLSTRATILMRYVLWRKGIRVANANGIEVKFSVPSSLSGPWSAGHMPEPNRSEPATG